MKPSSPTARVRAALCVRTGTDTTDWKVIAGPRYRKLGVERWFVNKTGAGDPWWEKAYCFDYQGYITVQVYDTFGDCYTI